MNCQIDVDHDGPASFSRVEVRRSRRPRVCCECGDAIAVGDSYESTFGKWDGWTTTHDTCLLCAEIRDSLFCSWIYEHIWEAIAEESVFTLSLKGLSIAAIDKLEQFWKEHSAR